VLELPRYDLMLCNVVNRASSLCKCAKKHAITFIIVQALQMCKKYLFVFIVLLFPHINTVVIFSAKFLNYIGYIVALYSWNISYTLSDVCYVAPIVSMYFHFVPTTPMLFIQGSILLAQIDRPNTTSIGIISHLYKFQHLKRILANGPWKKLNTQTKFELCQCESTWNIAYFKYQNQWQLKTFNRCNKFLNV
jgi:hypothetical protein